MREIKLLTVEPGPIAVVRKRTTFAEVPRALFGALDAVYATVRSGKIRQSGHNVAVYRPLGGGHVDLEAGVEVAAPFENVGGVVSSETPGGEVAMAEHIGPYDRLGETYDAIVAWVRANGRKLAGVNWEVYGDWSEDPAKLRADVYMMLVP